MNYDNLIRDKRTKMLYLILLLLLYPFFNVTGINLTYIVRKDEVGFSPSCIAEELERYAGIGWIYPIPSTPQHLPRIVTKYIPTIENNFNCEFSKNSQCNIRWSLKDWHIDNSSPKTKDFITNSRWESLPTILVSNTSQEFEERIEIENNFNVAFSVRADGLVEILICSGWNPYNYPCYYFHLDYREIYLKQYAALPKDIKDDYKTDYLEKYKAYSNILAHDEWRSFILRYDMSGLLQLIDVNLNRTLIEHSVKEPLAPMYMLKRSANCSLWKIHENGFLFTNTTQISRLGPQISLPNRDLCISMFVKVCNNCQLTFFYLNVTRKDLKTIGSTKNEEWMEIKLKEENTQYDKLNIFVETKYKDSSTSTSGFWAIDDVRVCNENEVKVSFLILNNTKEQFSEDNFTCQLIKKPSWRPKKLVFDRIEGFPKVSTTSTSDSIRIKWPREDPLKSIRYFINYGANDLCSTDPHNPKRLKSNGFVSTTMNEIVLDDLIPFTVYNVTISSILHETDKTLFISTLESAEPTLEELPSNIQLKVLDTSLNVSWEEVNCFNKYGRIAYTLIVSNSVLNFSKELDVQTNTSYEISGLKPYTNYTLTVLTARNGRNLYKRSHIMNYTLDFRTMPGIAPPPENLEIYSMDKNSASLRYDLPTNSNGVIKVVQISRCNSLSYKKCKSSTSIIKRCSLWPQHYCADVNYLIPFQHYTFRVGLRNLDTPSFGKEASVQGFAVDRIPGKPTNVTYKTVDCTVNSDFCNLNITWLHPYYQNGTITSFELILKSLNDTEDDKSIHIVYDIKNNTYYYDYNYQVPNISYSSHYNLYLQSSNDFHKSKFTEVLVKTDDIGKHIDQTPKLIEKTGSTLSFEIPGLDRRLQSYSMTVVVQDYDKTKEIDENLIKDKKVLDILCHPFGETWISQVIKVDSNKVKNITIGHKEKEQLHPNQKYCITFIITNDYKGSKDDVVYYNRLKMENQLPRKEASAESSFNHLYLLLLMLLIIPVGFLIYRYFRKRRLIKKPVQTHEHEYETLPGDEIDLSNGINGKTQAVSNNMYS